MTTTSRSEAYQPSRGFFRDTWLWLSYQRYALLLALGGVGLVSVPACLLPDWWWLWGLAALIAFPIVLFGGTVYRNYPRKIKATRRADERIRAGTFEPEFVQKFCGDPCSIVVANEILCMADIPKDERKALIKRFIKAEREQGKTLLLVDRNAGVIHTIQGGNIKTEKIAQPNEISTERTEPTTQATTQATTQEEGDPNAR